MHFCICFTCVLECAPRLHTTVYKLNTYQYVLAICSLVSLNYLFHSKIYLWTYILYSTNCHFLSIIFNVDIDTQSVSFHRSREINLTSASFLHQYINQYGIFNRYQYFGSINVMSSIINSLIRKTRANTIWKKKCEKFIHINLYFFFISKLALKLK